MLGTSHVSTGTPCQDSSACDVVGHPATDEILIAVVSDGAGSARLSQIGSTEACRHLVRRLIELFDAGYSVIELTPPIAIALIRDLQSHLHDTAVQHDAALRDLACTLVAAVIAPTAAFFIQVGDGLIVVSPRTDPIDEFSWIFWPERGEYANTTVFLSDSDVIDHVQHLTVPYGIDEVALLTDGLQDLVLDYRERSPHAPFFSRMMAPLRHSHASNHLTTLSEALATYLASPNVCDRTDDDKTLVLASRRLNTD